MANKNNNKSVPERNSEWRPERQESIVLVLNLKQQIPVL